MKMEATNEIFPVKEKILTTAFLCKHRWFGTALPLNRGGEGGRRGSLLMTEMEKWAEIDSDLFNCFESRPSTRGDSACPHCCLRAHGVGCVHSAVQGIMLIPTSSCLAEHPQSSRDLGLEDAGVPLSRPVVIFAKLHLRHANVPILFSCRSCNVGQKRLWLSVVLKEEELSWPLLQLEIALKHST